MKILYVTTIGGTMVFFKSFIEQLIVEGHTVDIATNDTTSKVPDIYRELKCNVYHISCLRSPLKKETFTTISELKKIVAENNYDIVHCHTPIAAMCTRIACRQARKRGTKVYYTAHGFHFYKGAPLKNWLIFYPIEKLCTYWTDVLITINKEDYALAQRKLKAKKIEYVPGVGIDVEKFSNVRVEKSAKRREIGVPEDAVMLLSVGELNENKNHEVVIRALAELPDNPVHYAIAGRGSRKEYLENLAKELHVNLHLLGYRRDVAELYKTADAFALPSLREGLNVSVMEAMASGLPLICGNIRGNVDMIDENGGFLFDPHSAEDCRKAIGALVNSDTTPLGRYNHDKAQMFSVENVNQMMKEIYEFYK